MFSTLAGTKDFSLGESPFPQDKKIIKDNITNIFMVCL
jgi:hypothetical protein